MIDQNEIQGRINLRYNYVERVDRGELHLDLESFPPYISLFHEKAVVALSGATNSQNCSITVSLHLMFITAFPVSV